MEIKNFKFRRRRNALGKFYEKKKNKSDGDVEDSTPSG